MKLKKPSQEFCDVNTYLNLFNKVNNSIQDKSLDELKELTKKLIVARNKLYPPANNMELDPRAWWLQASIGAVLHRRIILQQAHSYSKNEKERALADKSTPDYLFKPIIKGKKK